MSNKKNQHYYQTIKEFLGTHLIPKGILLVEQLNKNAAALNDYVAKKNKIREQLKGLSSTSQEYLILKNKLNAVRKNETELRLEFIPFEREEKKAKTRENYNEDLAIHRIKVDKRIQKLLDISIEKYGKRYQKIETVDSFRNTSIKHKVRI